MEENRKREILYKQLELLAEDSEKERAHLIENTRLILDVTNLLLAYGW